MLREFRVNEEHFEVFSVFSHCISHCFLLQGIFWARQFNADRQQSRNTMGLQYLFSLLDKIGNQSATSNPRWRKLIQTCSASSNCLFAYPALIRILSTAEDSEWFWLISWRLLWSHNQVQISTSTKEISQSRKMIPLLPRVWKLLFWEEKKKLCTHDTVFHNQTGKLPLTQHIHVPKGINHFDFKWPRGICLMAHSGLVLGRLLELKKYNFGAFCVGQPLED